DAAAVNTTRWALSERLQALGLPVECGTGGRTKFNRVTRGLEKTHWQDAACVGASTPAVLILKGVHPLLITAYGRGCRQMCSMDEFGFPRTKPKAKRFTHAFRTGDIVRATIPAPLAHAGVHVGKLAARAKGSFKITTKKGTIDGVGKTYCTILQRADGYGYAHQSPPAGAGSSSPA
ncbi:MAG: HNH endonuclease, partial [Ktedonobacteraceae bacterium]